MKERRENPTADIEVNEVEGYPRSPEDDDYTYWQWVIAEEYVNLEDAKDDGATSETIAAIQSRIDLYAVRFQAAIPADLAKGAAD
jgi:hypothetical protein